MELNDVMTQGSYFIFNKIIAREYGFDSAVLLGELFNRYKMYSDSNSLVDGMFYLSRNTILNDIGMTPDRQRTALKKIVEAELVTVKRKGTPSQNYYYVDVDKVAKTIEKLQLSEKPTTSHRKNPRLVVDKTDTINNNNINNYINNNYNKGNSETESYGYYPSREVLDKQISKCYKLNGIDDTDTIENGIAIINYYFDSYRYYLDDRHKTLSERAMRSVLDSIEQGFKECDSYTDMEMYKELIDKHFITEYANCDYNICHFFSGDIRYLRYCETLR